MRERERSSFPPGSSRSGAATARGSRGGLEIRHQALLAQQAGALLGSERAPEEVPLPVEAAKLSELDELPPSSIPSATVFKPSVWPSRTIARVNSQSAPAALPTSLGKDQSIFRMSSGKRRRRLSDE